MADAPQVLMIAGEASADAHGAQVLRHLKKRHPQVKAFGIGGALMRAEGFEPVARAEDIAIAGLTEVLFAIPRILGIMRRIARQARTRKPDLAILIDLPDFNLRLAKRLKKQGIPIAYYVSPQLWAWRKGRVEQIRQLVDKMLVILPFETEFYREHNVPVEFVGHPLVEELPAPAPPDQARKELELSPPGKVIALLPGSRRKEITRHLPRMMESITRLQQDEHNLTVLLPVASTISKALVENIVSLYPVDVHIIEGKATEVLQAADAAVVCSGTATLQAALLGKPMVVVYRVSWLTYWLLKRLVSVAHIALVNLVAGKRLVTELIQSNFTPDNVAHELRTLLRAGPARQKLLEGYSEVRNKLGASKAGERVAQIAAGYFPAVAQETRERDNGPPQQEKSRKNKSEQEQQSAQGPKPQQEQQKSPKPKQDGAHRQTKGHATEREQQKSQSHEQEREQQIQEHQQEQQVQDQRDREQGQSA